MILFSFIIIALFVTLSESVFCSSGSKEISSTVYILDKSFRTRAIIGTWPLPASCINSDKRNLSLGRQSLPSKTLFHFSSTIVPSPIPTKIANLP